MVQEIRVSETLTVEIGTVMETGEKMLVLDRAAGGLVSVHLSEVKALVAALSEAAARLAAEAAGDDFVETDELW